MDKRSASRAQPDLRKQDGAASKVWPRSSKKREPNQATNQAPIRDVARKQPAQRGKSFDKRPRPRGAYHGATAGGKTDSRLEENEAEVGSIFVPGSKKHNLNHLLNFQYQSRDSSHHPSGRGGRKSHGLVYTNAHKHNKELFLQSNCQFVVKAGGDYTPYFVDPDIPISWDVIEQINVRVNEPLSCPICLGETVAGRITRCGHTYCWSCLLHYFSLSDDSNRPCPICFQPIDKYHLKSVQGIWQNYVPVGNEIHMKLMRRLRSSTTIELAPPLDATDDVESVENLLSISDCDTIYSKLLTASPQEVSCIIMRERKELSDQLSPELEHPEFILQALHMLQQREDKLLTNLVEVPVIKVQEKATKIEDQEVFQFDSNEDVKENLGEPSNINKKKIDKYFYFYQAADGQAAFLHGLNLRIIEATWGSLSLAPRELSGVILERASGSVGLEARRRLRCLQHLPIHCPYDLVEIQLKPPHVSYESIEMFKTELEDRKRQRLRRARDEKRREKVIHQKEQVIMGHIPEMKININSEEHFPAYQPDLDMTPPNADWKWDKESNDSSPGPSSLSSQGNGLSFAKMASASGTWKVRQSAQVLEVSPRIQNDSDCSEDQEAAAPPMYNLSDMITEALQNTSLNVPEESSSGRDGKKKKKFKPKVLFATGMQHRMN